MEQKNNAIVIGGNHHNTLGVIRALGYKGIPSHVIVVSNNPKPYVCYSKYVMHYYVLTSEKEIVKLLLTIKSNFTSKPVVFSCADFVTAELNSHKSQLTNFYHLPVCEGNILHVMDKDTMARIANGCGITIPKTFTLNALTFDGTKKYILKPKRSIEGGKSDISIVSNREELEAYQLSSHCDLQVQQFVEKELEFQLIGCSLNGGEKIIIPGASVIIRQPENTNTGFLKYISIDKIRFNKIKECHQFLQSIGYSGLFSMEFVRGKDGKDYFLEINLRNDGNAICVTAAGVNLPYIWYSYCIGTKAWQQEATRIVHEVYVMPEFDDFVNVLKHRISFHHWWKDVHRTDCFMEYDKQDTKPFYIGLMQQIFNYTNWFFRKLLVIR